MNEIDVDKVSGGAVEKTDDGKYRVVKAIGPKFDTEEDAVAFEGALDEMSKGKHKHHGYGSHGHDHKKRGCCNKPGESAVPEVIE